MLNESALSTGIQATLSGKAIIELNRMIDAKMNDTLTEEDIAKQKRIPFDNWQPTPCTIFMSYTSNLISAGTREHIRYLVQHKMVDCIVSSAGGVEEDFVKCFSNCTVGNFELVGKEMFQQRINRNGNIILSLKHYALLEDWIVPIMDEMLKEQDEGEVWTPCKFIHRLGKEINNEESVYYWAWKNNIPVFCPALTDGAFGDILFFHHYKHDGRTLSVNIVPDVMLMFHMTSKSKETGMFLLGGGVSKHHVLNANAMRDGGNYAVFINTAQEFDGCDSGARPDEGVTWGKVHVNAKPVKVFSEASLVLPLLIAQTFFKRQSEFEKLLSK